MSRVLNIANIKKTIRYLKKNGVSSAYYAALERSMLAKNSTYSYANPTSDELKHQREDYEKWNEADKIKITVVMPCFETPKKFFVDAVDALLSQSYPNWELIVADASNTDVVRELVHGYDTDTRVKYVRLKENLGISGNTNEAFKYADGDYVALLDHDDVYTPDALYHMAVRIKDSHPEMLYSDEDKLESDTGVFYDPNIKYKFNYDLILTNNYICHLLCVRKDILDGISLRKEYDGAQDYDFVLQVIRHLVMERNISILELDKHIVHVPHVLYHWRSHEASTSANTASKMYAYEAGLHALEEHIEIMHGAKELSRLSDSDAGRALVSSDRSVTLVSHSKHLGFYTIDWESMDGNSTGKNYHGLFEHRPEIGAVICRVIDKHGKMIPCIYNEFGETLYAGLDRHFAGELNRFDCAQDVYAADPKYMIIRPELQRIIEQRLKDEKSGDGVDGPAIDVATSETGRVLVTLGSLEPMELGAMIRDLGYLVYYDPSVCVNKS